jgi:quercetin dioxygenase-like cupin family protein
MKELSANKHFKVVKVEMPAGTNMPRHYATSDAFVIVEAGDALLIFKGETCELKPGCNLLIPAFEPHLLRIIADFRAFIVLASDALITYSTL